MENTNFDEVFDIEDKDTQERAIFSKKNINYVDFLVDTTKINTYINHLNLIKGKSLNKKVFCSILYLMKTYRVHYRAVFFKISDRHKMGAKPAHIKVSGRDYTIPLPMTTKQSFSFLLRHIRKGSSSQKNTSYSKRLFLELGSLCFLNRKSYTKESFTILLDKYVEDRIYSHYRW